MYQLAIFDLDGTLVNSIADLGGTANRLLEQRGLPTHPLDAYYRFVGNGVHKLCERCLPADTPADEVERFFAAFNEDYSRHCLDKTAPYAGIPEVLEQLRSAGVHIAVASNKTQPFVEKIVKHYFGENGFDQILGSSDSRPKKPSPEIISVILENAGMTPEQAVMIGDSNRGHPHRQKCRRTFHRLHLGLSWQGRTGRGRRRRSGGKAGRSAEIHANVTGSSFIFSGISGKIEICLTIPSFLDIMGSVTNAGTVRQERCRDVPA